MPELLTTIDKFTFRVAADRQYAPDGIWVQPLSGARLRLGVTDYFQQHNGDVAFANIKPPGSALRPGDAFAEIETMKVTLEVAAPVAGTLLRANPSLEAKPELVNQDPYGEGWLAEIETADWPADRAKLLDPKAYVAAIQADAEKELKS